MCVCARAQLEAFACHNGARFYGLDEQPARPSVTLVREEWQLPEFVPFGDTVVVPFRAGGTAKWRREAGDGMAIA